jgi:hypothetical protein
MRKLILLGVAMLAIVLVATAPAIAQVGQGFSERRIQSGPSSPKVEIKNSGDNVNLCASPQQIGQTGNVANEQGALPFFSTSDDIDFTGSSLTVGTENAPATLTATCTQENRSAAAAG